LDTISQSNKELFLPYMEGSETLIWVGRPEARRIAFSTWRLVYAVAIAAALFLLGLFFFTLLLEGHNNRTGFEAVFLIGVAAFTILASLFTLFRPVRAYLKLSHIRYAISNLRVLMLTEEKLESMALLQLDVSYIRPRRGHRGDVLFKANHHRPNKRDKLSFPGFLWIRDAHPVANILEAAIETAVRKIHY